MSGGKHGRTSIQQIKDKPESRKSYDGYPFSWSIKSVYKEAECWQIEWQELHAILVKLEDYETQTWNEIKSASGGKAVGNGSNSHFISADKLPKKYKDIYIKSGYMNKYDSVFSLRLTGKKRLIGYRDRDVFYILWYDADHRIFPSKH